MGALCVEGLNHKVMYYQSQLMERRKVIDRQRRHSSILISVAVLLTTTAEFNIIIIKRHSHCVIFKSYNCVQQQSL